MSVTIEWGKIDPLAKANSTPTMANVQPFSNVALLKSDEADIKTIDYATVGELNQTVLDGSQPLIPDNPDPQKIVLWSKACSDANGYFSTNPILEAVFSDVVTSDGLTLTFWPHNNEYCREIKIRWYDASNALMSETTFYPDSYRYTCSKYMAQYKRIQIEFVRTCFPKRFVKYEAILYGEMVNLTEKNIINAHLIENLGLTSRQISSNQLSCEILALEDNFNIISNPGKFRGLRLNQPLTVKNGNKQYGQYYIKKSSVNDNVISITALDLVGRLESSEFKGGLYNNTTFGSILAEIKEQAHTSDLFSGVHDGFDVSSSILAKTFTGYIPYTDCREALHQLCYAANVVANCKRGEKIVIYELNSIKKDTLDDTKRIMGSTNTQDNESYTGVILNGFSYNIKKDISELENKNYGVGSHTLKFNEPYSGYTITGGTITSSGANYVTFNVATAGTVVINGYGYEEVKQEFIADNPSYTGNTPSRKELTDVKLIGPEIAKSVAEKQLWYYTQSYVVNSNVLGLVAGVGDNVDLWVLNGYIQQVETDLLEEDICTVEVLGNAKSNNG